jgi:methionyl-tRNA synthetase
MSRFYLTTAIDYVNSRPHLGTAYEKICADVIARYRRLAGFDTHFVMGNDEHSQNVFRKAKELGEDPQAYCDRMAQQFLDVWKRLDISFDDFIRTTEPRHRTGVQALIRRIDAAGDLYEGHYEGWYCVSCEAFKQERDLVDGLCPIHRTKPEWIREKNHFFRLSTYRDALLKHFDAHPDFLVPDIRRNEILRLLEAGLEDISVSRAGQSWGIPMPNDSSSVVYVWVDALINYLSAAGFGTDDAMTARWWPADLHVIGKDITRFHAVIWPAMLMSAGVALPRQIFGHGWVHLRGEKMSKSLGTAVDPLEVVDLFGPDPLRLYVVKEITFGSDGDFSWERYEDRYNADLANGLGNLVSRVTSMVVRYRNGRLIPTGSPGWLGNVAAESLTAYREAMDAHALHEAAAAVFRLIAATNEFIAQEEPWALARDPDPESADWLTQVLLDAADAVRVIGIQLLPIMPSTAAAILRQMGETRRADELRLDDAAEWRKSGERLVQKADPLFPRRETTRPADDAETLSVRETMSNRTPLPPDLPDPGAVPDVEAPVAVGVTAPAPAAVASPADDACLPIEEFMKIDLRVAKVIAAERVPKSKKLLKLQVDVGSEQRTLVAGIAEAYEPEALIGRSVVIVANLKPAKLMGIESNGMVLAASPEGGQPELLGFATPPAPGTQVR